MKPAARQSFGRTTLSRLTDLECRDELGEGHEEEVQVEEELELFVEDNGKESERVVLLISDDIWWVSRLQFICTLKVSRRHVEVIILHYLAG